MFSLKGEFWRQVDKHTGEGNGCPLQYSCLENSMDTEAWWATVHGIAELETNERLVDGETVETVTLYFWGLQNHCRW